MADCHILILQFQSHSMNTSGKAVASRANAGQMLEASGLNHLIKAVHRQHGGKGGDSRSAGRGTEELSGGSTTGSGASGSADAGRPGNVTRAAAVKAAMVHAWRG